MSFPPEALSRDAFLGGRLQLWQPRQGYRAAVDPVLLAAFVPARPGERVLELGCGGGTAALCLARRVPELELHGVEIQADYAELARRNAAENGLPLEVHLGDVLDLPADLRRASFDQVLANPPFHAASDPAAQDAGRDRAHRGADLLGRWIAAGLTRLAPGGALTLIHRAERLGEILAALLGRAGAIEILPVAPRAGRPARRVLVRARKSSRAPLVLHSPFTLHEGRTHGSEPIGYTGEAERIVRDMAPLLPDSRLGGTSS